MKMNALVDVGIVDALYAASQRGVAIDLLVRGPCVLRPGVTGLSETIRVRSIVGRFLEHSRIYRFSRRVVGGLDRSADMMDRNLDRRFEALVRIDEPALMDRLDGILDLAWADNTHAWNLRANGKWARVAPGRAPISLGTSSCSRPSRREPRARAEVRRRAGIRHARPDRRRIGRPRPSHPDPGARGDLLRHGGPSPRADGASPSAIGPRTAVAQRGR